MNTLKEQIEKLKKEMSKCEEIAHQWACYKRNKNSLTENDLRTLKEEAKKLGIILK